MIVLIDSWAWIEYFRGTEKGEKVKEYVDGDYLIIISAINIAEVYRWILWKYDEETAEEKDYFMRRISFVVDVTAEIAKESAKIKHEKKWGLGDSIIYATAIQEHAKTVTGDPDFKNVENVIFIE